MDEYWDLLNEEREPLGLLHLRGDKIPVGMYHLVVHSWIMDDNGRFLISQRQVGRTDELLWERTGGSVLAGETSLQSAIREVKEELGIDIYDCRHFFIKSERRDSRQDFFDAWLFLVDNSHLSCKIDEKEVLAWKWVTLEDMDNLKQHHLLVTTSEYYDEVYRFYESLNVSQQKMR